MFGILKKKLKESVQKLVGRARTEEAPKEVKKPEPKIEVKKKPEIKKPEKKIEAKKHHIEDLAEKVKESVEEIKKEVEHIDEEQTVGAVEDEESPLQEEIKEENVEEESEEEVESVKEPIVEPVLVEPEEKIEEELHIKIPEPIKEEKKSFKERLFGKVKFKSLSENDINDFFDEIEPDLLSANIAIEVVEFLRANLKEELVGKEASRLKTDKDIKNVFAKALVRVLDQGKVDFKELIRKSKENGRPAVIVFLGFNGSGKTTSIAKLANYMKNNGYSPVLAAGDTFRAAAIDQLEIHGNRIGVKVIKHQYGADSAAVIFDAVKHAESKGLDVVLADTAGRTHTNINLIDELKKVVRVNKPDLKVLVIDGLTGNDAVEQAKQFDKDIGVDTVVITKVDVDEKGGAILSVAYSIKKPILFLGIGQGYEDFKIFEPEEFVKSLLE